MLLPMPSPPVQIGPPTEFARKMRGWLFALLLLQTVVCVLRFVCLLDIMGGFIMLIMVGMGWYAWKEDMHITFICSWGCLCLINGAFDLVRFLDYVVKSQDPLFSTKYGFWRSFETAIFIAIPVVSLLGAFLARHIYLDYCAQTLPLENVIGAVNSARGGYGAAGGRREINLDGDRAALEKPFGGKGHKLGSES